MVVETSEMKRVVLRITKEEIPWEAGQSSITVYPDQGITLNEIHALMGTLLEMVQAKAEYNGVMNADAIRERWAENDRQEIKNKPLEDQ